jgi:hypothetical protein
MGSFKLYRDLMVDDVVNDHPSKLSVNSTLD